jgi:hypothetical protein
MAGGKNGAAVEKRSKKQKVSLCFVCCSSHFNPANLNFRTRMLQSILNRHTSCGWAKIVLESQTHCLASLAHSISRHYIGIL